MAKTSNFETQVATWGAWRGTTSLADISAALAIVKEARLAGGPAAVVEVWEKLPLPPLAAFRAWQAETFPHYDFLRHEVAMVEGARTPCSEVYQAYLNWCAETPVCSPVNQNLFGRAVREFFGDGVSVKGGKGQRFYALVLGETKAPAAPVKSSRETMMARHDELGLKWSFPWWSDYKGHGETYLGSHSMNTKGDKT